MIERPFHIVCCVVLGVVCCCPQQLLGVPDSLAQLTQAVPTSTADCTADQFEILVAAANKIEKWSADLTWQLPQQPELLLEKIDELLQAKAEVAAAMERCWNLRRQFAEDSLTGNGRERIRIYLQMSGLLVDLMGRLRYTLRDAIDNAAVELEADSQQFQQLVAVLHARRDSMGAAVLSYVLFDPEAEADVEPFPVETKRAVLQLMAAAPSESSIPVLADFLREPSAADELKLEAAGVLKQLGLPQDPIPHQKPTENDPPPAIVAAELLQIIESIDQSSLPSQQQRLRAELVDWLRHREKQGLVEGTQRIGQIEVRPGDWLLQRNPSPYNRFTDISPGLFTHIAIVAEHVSEDGKRHIVAIDMPERSAHIPATNVETFLGRSLHYMILRPVDRAAAAKLSKVAAETIGNEAQFDLEFRTDRMKVQSGKSLRGERMHSYCASFLLTCVQASGYPRETFFPIEENPASELCQTNLRKLGLSLGDRFVSPTGPLFATHLQLVGEREPLYDPGREIKETVYDHFAAGMTQRELKPSPDLVQALRLQAAQLSRTNPWLARALAQANGVSPQMDLESAAKAAAVIETLDRIADEGWHTFEEAREAIMAGSDDELAQLQLPPAQREHWKQLRVQHARLLTAWQDGTLSPRDLRLQLVHFYSAAGCRRIDERFF